MKTFVMVGEVLFDVVGTYEPYQEAALTADPYYSAPAEGGYFEIEYVYIGNQDVTEWLNIEFIELLEELAYKEISA